MSRPLHDVSLTSQLEAAFLKSRVKQYMCESSIRRRRCISGVSMVVIWIVAAIVLFCIASQQTLPNDLQWNMLSAVIGLISIPIPAIAARMKLSPLYRVRDRHSQHAEQVLVLLYRLKCRFGYRDVEYQLFLILGQQLEISAQSVGKHSTKHIGTLEVRARLEIVGLVYPKVIAEDLRL